MISMIRLISILLFCIFGSQAWSFVPTISPIYANDVNDHFYIGRNIKSEVQIYNYDSKSNTLKSVVDLQAVSTDENPRIRPFFDLLADFVAANRAKQIHSVLDPLFGEWGVLQNVFHQNRQPVDAFTKINTVPTQKNRRQFISRLYWRRSNSRWSTRICNT